MKKLVMFGSCALLMSTMAVTFAAGNPMQGTISRLQSQIKQVQASIPQKIHDQSAVTQKSIVELQTQIQKQITDLQKQIVEVQTNLNSHMQMLQKEVQEVSRMK